VRVHLARKHALEFELLHVAAEPIGIQLDLFRRGQIAFFGREIEQFTGVGEPPREPIQAADHQFEFGALLAEFLRAIRLVPNTGLL
jgi:hypothetical protein